MTFVFVETVGIWILTIWKLETFECQTFLSSDFKWSIMCYVLCTRPTIQKPDQNIRKQDGTHLSGIQMEFEYPTSSVFRSPLYINFIISKITEAFWQIIMMIHTRPTFVTNLRNYVFSIYNVWTYNPNANSTHFNKPMLIISSIQIIYLLSYLQVTLN